MTIRRIKERELADQSGNAPSLSVERGTKEPSAGRAKLSEGFFRPLIEFALPDALFVHDDQGRFLEVNRRACESLGYSRDELLAMGVADIEQKINVEYARKQWDRVRPGHSITLFGRHRRKDGSTFPAESHFGCHEMDGQRLFVCITRSIDERYSARGAQHRSEECFRKVFTHAVIGIAITDWAGNFLQCNPAYCRLLGYTEDELKSIDFSTLIHPEDRDANLTRMEWLRSGEIADFNIENRYVRRDGRSVWVRKHVSALPDEMGQPTAILALVTDITERKHVELALAEREEQYRAVIETATDGFWMLDEQGRILSANEAYAKRSGYTREELQGMPLALLEGQESADAVAGHIEEIQRKGSDRFETWHRTKNGERWPVEVTASYWPRAKRFFAFLRDISERREAALALQESEARFRATFEQAAVGIAHVALDGRWLRVNRKLCEIVGYSQEELLSIGFQDITHPDDKDSGQTRFRRMLAGSNETLVLEKRYVHKDGGTIWVNLTVAAAHNPDGSLAYFIAVIEDISGRKRTDAAMQALYAEMEQLTRFQIANQTAAAFAHELNQPLNAVASYAEAALRLLRAGNPRPDRLLHAVESSAQQAQRAGRVVREFLAFMSQSDVPTEAVELNSVVHAVLTRVSADGFNLANFRLELDPLLAPVRANRLQVEKVLINLVENSIEAMQTVGVGLSSIAVTVRTAMDEAMAKVTVTDRGPGIDSQTVQRIFDPFFSTKRKGLGMGLAISRAIIESYGGQLWVDSQPGAGASFHFTLPFAE